MRKTIKRKILFLTAAALLVFTFPAFAQDEPAQDEPAASDSASSSPLSDGAVVLSYQRNFARAGISTKLELLSGAANIPSVDMTPLYKDALHFAVSSRPLLGEDKQLADIALLALRAAASSGDSSFLEPAYEVFSLFSSAQVKAAAIEAIAAFSAPDSEGFNFLKGWIEAALDDSESGAYVNPEIMQAAIAAFAGIGGRQAFPLVFRAATSSNLDASVTAQAEKALLSLDEGFAENILAVIGESDPAKTQAAFNFARKKDSLSSIELGEIAESVFNSMLDLDGRGNLDAEPVLQSAMEVLTELKWYQASPSVLQYFYRVQSAENSNAEKLIPVINCLGAMGTNEAAQALSIYLGLLNSETEQKKTYSEKLMLSIINALGELGDKAAFDYLLYVGYLDYSERVKEASRDALARLKW